MLDQGIDVLLLAPSDRNQNVKCVEAAKQRGVPVISYDRLVCDADVDVYLSFDNMMVGRLMAESLLAEVPEGGYVLVNGSPDDYNSTMIREGYMAVLQSKIAAGRIKILDETWVDNWVRESAFSFASTAAKTFGSEIDAIICGNDSLAWGVIDALNEAQISEQVAIVGMDADLVACRRIVSGQQLMTVYKPIKDLVASAVELCTQLAGGGKTFADETINDGTYDVPYVAIGVIAVTKDNIDETVIQDGFHLREDIYSLTPGE